MTNKSSNTVWHHATVGRADRETLHGHKSVVLWFTGLSGSGKSTLAHAVQDFGSHGEVHGDCGSGGAGAVLYDVSGEDVGGDCKGE